MVSLVNEPPGTQYIGWRETEEVDLKQVGIAKPVPTQRKK